MFYNKLQLHCKRKANSELTTKLHDHEFAEKHIRFFDIRTWRNLSLCLCLFYAYVLGSKTQLNTVCNMTQIICEQCNAASRGSEMARGSSTSSQRHLVHVQKFQMMDNAVQPSQRRPTIVADQQRSQISFILICSFTYCTAFYVGNQARCDATIVTLKPV